MFLENVILKHSGNLERDVWAAVAQQVEQVDW